MSKSQARTPTTPPHLSVKRQLLFCIEKLLNVISRRQRDLRNKCIDVQKELKSLKSDLKNGDRYWLIFQMSCQSQVPPIVEVALDSIQKLMAQSILSGQTRDRNGKPLIDVMVRTICDCCAIESEKVQLQIVKAILTLGTSQNAEVHGQSLLMCLRACYNIFLSTKNIDVQTSAKAVLTQIVCAVFQKMERTQQLSLKKQAAKDNKSESHLLCRSIIVGLSNNISIQHKYDEIIPYTETISNSQSATPKPQKKDQNDKKVKENEQKEEDSKDNKSENIKKNQPKSEQQTPPKNKSIKSIKCGKFGWCVLCSSPASHYCIQTRDPVCSLDCKMSNLKNSIHFLQRALNISDDQTTTNDTISRLQLAYKSTVLTNDGHILFRALCRQAHKTLPTDNISKVDQSSSSWLDFKIPRLFDPHSAMKPLALKSKVLSLELLRLVFSNTGQSFKSSHRFIDAVRECFVPVVTENAVSTVENIFQLAVNMFALLVDGYRKYLKNEIGVLLDNVFLQIAESPHSNFKQKKMALSVFNKIVRNPQVLIGIFLNYDCGHNHQNIFQRIIDLLEKICSVKQVNEHLSWSPQLVENVELRRLSIEILVNIIRFANEWVVKANKQNSQAYEERFHQKEQSVNSEEDKNKNNEFKEDQNEENESSALQHLQRYAEKKKNQQNILNAVLKFNLKPKEGIKYLTENKLIENSVEAIVDFLKNTPSLNKTQIGDYMGGAKPFNIQIMHSFIDSIDFYDIPLDVGIRRLCTHFKLPGEAAQIDRIMQKFAERYCLQNPQVFKEADDAYILSYAIIMLNVALHHPQIKKRMTKEEFGKNNLLAVTDKKLLPLMHEVYDRIQQKEILLDDKNVNGKERQTVFAGFAWMNGLYNHNTPQNGSSYLEQRADIIERVNTKCVQPRIGTQRRRENIFYEAHSEDVGALQPMFSIVWLASLATFSVLLEDPSAEILLQYYQQSYYGKGDKTKKNATSKNEKNKYSADQLIGLCLNGYRYGIKFASNLGMDVEAESYVNSLAGLTLLGTEKTMQQKNVEAIKTLLKIADEEGNILRKSWVQILKCVSELDVLHLMKTKAVSDSSHFLQKKEAKKIYGTQDHEEGNRALKKARKQQKLSSDGIIRYESQHMNVSSVTAAISQSMIDKIYQDSVKLDSEGIVHFSVGLSCVSAMELDNLLNPRVFSLRKIVEVAHDNINLRIPLVWQRIWNVLSPHFVKAGCHNNPNIGAYAINSLRQLALLFFEKEELANFQFQNKFLIPFQHIMERSKSQEIRLLIVECIFRIIKARFSNVKSGWKTVFCVLGIAAKDPHEELSSATFKITEQILTDYFPLLSISNETDSSPQILANETLDECVNCLVSFSGNIWTDISLKAINNLVLCAQHLYNLDNIKQIKESPMIKAWFLCLTGLSRLIFDERIEVRGKSLEAMFCILEQHGANFSASMWELIFRGVLLPIFDDIYHNQIQHRSSILAPSNQQIMQNHDTNWLESTGVTALAQLIALFCLFFENCRFMLDKIALLLQSGINQLNEQTAKISVKCWKLLIEGTAEHLNDDEWKIIISSLSKSASQSLPFAFSNNFFSKCVQYENYQKKEQSKNNQNGRYPMPKYNKSVTSVQCMVHIIVLDQLFNIAIKHADKISIDRMHSIIICAESSYKFSREFNANTKFRNFLQKAAHSMDASESVTMPNLYFQESRSSSIIFEILMTLCSHYTPSQIVYDKSLKLRFFAIHKTKYMDKLYSFCNLLVESYCNDASIQPFLSSTCSPISIQQNKQTKNKRNASDNKGLRWKTGVIILLLDSILNDDLWQNSEEQQQFILNLYDYLILCIAIDNREIRQRISRLFGGCIKQMLNIPIKKKPKEKNENNVDDGKVNVDTDRIVSV